MIKRFVSLVFGLGMLGLAVAIGLAGWIGYQRMTAQEDPGSFSFNRERPLDLEAGRLERVNITPKIEVFGEISPAREQALTFELGGVLSELSEVALVGGNVRQGDVLARLKVDDSLSTARSSRLGLDEAEVRLKQVQDQKAVVEREVEAIQRSYDLANEQFTSRQRLAERGFLSRNAIALDEQNLINSRSSLDTRIASLDDLGNQLELAELAVERAKLAEETASGDLASLVLRAPSDGFLSSSDVSVGQSVTPTSVIARFTGTDQVNVAFRIPFSDYGRLLADPEVDGNPEKLVGRDVEVSWRLGDITRSYEAKVSRVDRTAIAEAASVRVSARLEQIPFTDPLVIGAQVEVALSEAPLEDVFLVNERALSTNNEIFALADGALRQVSTERFGFSGDKAVVRGDFTGSVGYAPIRTRQMFNGAKVRVSNSEVLSDPIPASGEVAEQVDAVARADTGRPAADRTTAGEQRARPQRGQRPEGAGAGGGFGGGAGDDVEMIELTPDQQRALVAQVKSSRAPDFVKQRIIPQIESGSVPAPLLERLASRRRGG